MSIIAASNIRVVSQMLLKGGVVYFSWPFEAVVGVMVRLTVNIRFFQATINETVDQTIRCTTTGDAKD